jgi:hypothetical protein
MSKTVTVISSQSSLPRSQQPATGLYPIRATLPSNPYINKYMSNGKVPGRLFPNNVFTVTVTAASYLSVHQAF